MGAPDQQNVESGRSGAAERDLPKVVVVGVGSSEPVPVQTQAHTYSEALEIAGRGRFHTILLFVTGCCLMSVVNETVNVGFIISAAECDLQLTYTDKGLLNGAAFLGVVASSLVWGFLSDTWGRRKVLLLASCGALVFSVLSTFSPAVWVLIATRFLVGIFVSGNAATSYAYLAEFHGEASRARVISWAAMFMAIGLIFLPTLAWAIIPLEGRFDLRLFGLRYAMWRVYLLLCSLDLILIIAGLLFLPESGKFLLINGHREKVRQILVRIYRYNRREPEHTFPVQEVHLDPMDKAYADELQRRANLGLRYVCQQIAPLFRAPLLLHTLKASALMCGLFAASSGLFLWIPDILNTYVQHTDMKLCDVIAMVHESRAAAGHTQDGQPADICPIAINANIFIITALMGVVFLLCYVLNGFIINLVGAKALLNSWFVVCGICGIAVLWTSDFFLTLVLIAAFDASGCLGGILSAISVDLFPTNYRAMAMCLILMIGRLGAMAGSNLIAYLLSINCALIFYLFGGLLLICALIGSTLTG
ncbi:synaptic vesicle glycoprotein 2C isoform X1 [Anopheles bellator]|uniref:synaptic vesicle glycoprotein 2C isoform X1 n=1 Tax=Anopheles bellator TaxID=139047 RepID=UPI00264874AD|nr:synaptic vesicle glycoprotein 2C isoform X1 [Anopheles bellator]